MKLLFCILLASSVASAQVEDGASILTRVDEVFSHIQVKGFAAAENLQNALAELKGKYLEIYPSKDKQADFEYLWRLARLEYFVATFVLPANQIGDRLREYQEGSMFSEKAIALMPRRVEGYFWYTVNTGRFGELKGALRSLFLLKSLRLAIAKAAEIDPQYDGGGAFRVLGRIYHKVPGIFGGSNKKALQFLDDAIQTRDGSSRAMNFFFRGDVFFDQKQYERALNDYAMALKILEENVNPGELEGHQNKALIAEAVTKTKNLLSALNSKKKN